jgi:hypothetical protein
MAGWLTDLGGADTMPEGLAAWAAGYPTLAEAWRHALRPDWIVWLASREPADEERTRKMVLASHSLVKVAPKTFGDTVQFLLAPVHSDIELAEIWVRGGQPDPFQYGKDRMNTYVLAMLTSGLLTYLGVFLSPLRHTLERGGWWNGTKFNLALAIVFALLFLPVNALFGAIRMRSMRRRLSSLSAEKVRAIAVQSATAAMRTFTDAKRRFHLDVTLTYLPPPGTKPPTSG